MKMVFGTKQFFRREFCEPHASFVFRFELFIRDEIQNQIEIIALMYPIQTLWEYNVLFQEFPYHLNVNATL